MRAEFYKMPEAIPPGRIDLLLEKLTRDRVGPKTKMQCKVCWYVYDPALGCEEMDVPPGTPFNELPAHFVCPDCGNPVTSFIPLTGTKEP